MKPSKTFKTPKWVFFPIFQLTNGYTSNVLLHLLCCLLSGKTHKKDACVSWKVPGVHLAIQSNSSAVWDQLWGNFRADPGQIRINSSRLFQLRFWLSSNTLQSSSRAVPEQLQFDLRTISEQIQGRIGPTRSDNFNYVFWMSSGTVQSSSRAVPVQLRQQFNQN